MKLLLCDQCSDVIKLSRELRQCDCGHVKGRYLNDLQAEVNGNGYSIAFFNGSLSSAVRRLNATPDADWLSAALLVDDWPDTKFKAIVRPHSGLGNPNTTINKDL